MRITLARKEANHTIDIESPYRPMAESKTLIPARVHY